VTGCGGIKNNSGPCPATWTVIARSRKASAAGKRSKPAQGNALHENGPSQDDQPVRQFRLTGKDDRKQFYVCRLSRKQSTSPEGLKFGLSSM